MEKFIEKNKESLERLNTFIANEKKNIRLIITSIEVYAYLEKMADSEPLYNDTSIKYKGVRIISEVYYPPKKLTFVMKGMNEIDLNIPCMCGIYSDEKDP